MGRLRLKIPDSGIHDSSINTRFLLLKNGYDLWINDVANKKLTA
jgi:hypothetical protein